VSSQLVPTSEHHRVLLVEDDIELASLVRDYLTKNGFEIQVLNTGERAIETIVDGGFDLVILDIMLPGKSGMDICRELRPIYSGPILMLTALDDDMDQMLGLELGADDYIIKPVQPRLLLTRIRALMRRISSVRSQADNQVVNSSVIEAGVLIVNVSDRSVSFAGKPVDLTSAEFELLLLLANEIDRVVDRETIVQQLRGFEYDGLDRSIDRRISRLRKKLQTSTGEAEIIKTVRGKGYQLCAGNSLSESTRQPGKNSG